MADDNKSFLREVLGVLTSVTPVQWAAAIIGVLAIAGIIWTVAPGNDLSRSPERIDGLIKISAAIVIIAIALIVVFYLVSGSNQAPDSKSLKLEVMRIFMGVTPMQWVASLIGVFTIGGMVWVIATGADFFLSAEKARGLITFAVAIVTVAIALILVFYLVFSGGTTDEMKDRFTFGKDILMVFVGILGTIMGFYYGSDKISTKDVSAIASTVQNAATSTSDLEKKAFDLLLKQDYTGATKAFDDVYKSTPTSPNINNVVEIRKLLVQRSDEFAKADDPQQKKIWGEIFCEISQKKRAVGMAKDVIDEFDKNCKIANSTPTPSPSPAAATN